MDKHWTYVIVIFAAVAIIFLFNYFSSGVLLSPKQTYTDEVREFGYGPVSGLVNFLARLQNGLDGDVQISGMVGSQDIDVKGDENICAEICETFKTKKFRVRDPLDKGPLWWKEFWEGEEMEEENERIMRLIAQWLDGVSCSDGCGKGDMNLDVSLHMAPVTPVNGTCSTAGTEHSTTITATAASSGFFGAGACLDARIKAFKKFMKQLNDWLEKVCGSDCGYNLVMDAPEMDQQPGQDVCTVTISADAEVECTGVAWHTDYNLWVEIEACVQCVSEGDGDGINFTKV